MQTFLDVLKLGRHRVPEFVKIAVLVSFATVATLFEPWIYRAIIDDIAGVFVAPQPLTEAAGWLEGAWRSLQHLPSSWARFFTAPLAAVADAGTRVLESRSVSEATATVVAAAVTLVAIHLVAEWLKLAADNRAARLASEIERDFILRTFRHVVHLPLAFFTGRSSGVLGRQIDQSDAIAPIVTAAAQHFWPDFFRLIAILTVLAITNVQLAAIAAIAVAAYGVVTWRSAGHLDAEADRYYGLWDDVASRIQQVIAGIKTVQSHGNEAYEATVLADKTRDAYGAYLARTRLVNRYAWQQDAIVAFAKGGVLGLGGLKAIQHQLTPGDVVMFLAYLDRLFTPIENLTGLYTELQQHLASVRRAQRLLAHAAEERNDPPLAGGPGDVRFDDVTFGYRPRHPVLRRVSFRLKAGERTALVGPSGPGRPPSRIY